jgi:hypothetical protein
MGGKTSIKFKLIAVGLRIFKLRLRTNLLNILYYHKPKGLSKRKHKESVGNLLIGPLCASHNGQQLIGKMIYLFSDKEVSVER